MYFRLDDLRTAHAVFWLLSDGQRGAPTWPRSPAGWSTLIDYAEANGLGSVVARRLVSDGPPLPHEAHRRLERLGREMAAAANVAYEQAETVHSTLEEEEVPFFWLKGVAWGRSLYAALGTRPVRDLDLVVPDEALDRACRVLAGLGYRMDPLAGPALQHLPRFAHLTGTKIDLHHRIVPPCIYGFAVQDPPIPWGSGHGVMGDDPDQGDARFHLAHMIIHVFHHSFYNLRLMHLFDIRLALAAWAIPTAQVVDDVAELIGRPVTLDLLALCDELFDIGGQVRDQVRRRTVEGLLHRGSMPLGYPLSRIPGPGPLPRIARAEFSRCWFVLRAAPGRVGRPRAALHPPT
jgi:hypothetical protein